MEQLRADVYQFWGYRIDFTEADAKKHAADYGLLGPTFGKGAISPALTDSIVSRATTNLDRPPGAIRSWVGVPKIGSRPHGLAPGSTKSRRGL